MFSSIRSDVIKAIHVMSGSLFVSLTGHTDAVSSVVLSPDGTRLVTSHLDGAAEVWEVPSGRRLAGLLGHTNIVDSVAFSPDGTRIVTASQDRTVKVWEATSGHLLASFERYKHMENSAHQEQTVQAADRMIPGELQAMMEYFQAILSRFSWPTDAPNSAQQYQPTMQRFQAILEKVGWPMNMLNSVVFSPDGRLLVATSAERKVKGRKAKEGELEERKVEVWNVALETRKPAEIAALVQCKAPWRLDEGRLLPTTPAPTTCPPRSTP